jgi:hypothetical protein
MCFPWKLRATQPESTVWLPGAPWVPHPQRAGHTVGQRSKLDVLVAVQAQVLEGWHAVQHGCSSDKVVR